VLNGIKIEETYEMFLEENKNKFEKRKYLKVNDDLMIERREPSYIIELGYIYYKYKKNGSLNDEKKLEIEEIIKKESLQTYKSQEKKIERQSKIEIELLKERFWRTLLNQDKIHSLKLGNELIIRDAQMFFELMYKYSIISNDTNKLIKTYLCEIIYNDNGYSIELIKNIINYFVKSRNDYIYYDSVEEIKHFTEERLDSLYNFIYHKIYDNKIKNSKINENIKLELAKNLQKTTLELSTTKQIILEYLQNNKN
jgi:hypothetical protein